MIGILCQMADDSRQSLTGDKRFTFIFKPLADHLRASILCIDTDKNCYTKPRGVLKLTFVKVEVLDTNLVNLKSGPEKLF